MESDLNSISMAETMDVNACVSRAENFLREILPLTQMALSFCTEPGNRRQGDLEKPDVVIHFKGPDEDLLLENQAELLTALEHLVQKAARIPPMVSEKIGFDCKDWRLLRIRELKVMAEAAADRVNQMSSTFKFGPMRARERRIVHLALKEKAFVRAISEGQGPERHVVIYPGPGTS